MSGSIDVLVARQPILDRGADVVAYELLARRDLDAVTWTGASDDSRTTARIIGQAFLDMDVWSITEGWPAFINFPRELLLDGTAEALPAQLTVVEILESVAPDVAVRDACERLRAGGYRLALDDVVADDARLSLLDAVDVAKIDFAGTTPEERETLVARCHGAGVQVLAEKVERPEQHDEALRLGCDLFQGYFFQKPAVIGHRRLAGARLLHLHLLRSVAGSEIDRDVIGNVFARNPGAAERFRNLWPAVVPSVPPPATVRAALDHLDHDALVRLVTLLVVVWLGERHPRPLLDTALIRARFCELLTARGEASAALDGYLVGLCSLLDALVDEPLAAVLARIRPSPALAAACLRGEGRLGQMLDMVRAYEHGEWAVVRKNSAALGIGGATLGPLYLESLAWSRRLVQRAGTAKATAGW